MTDTPPVVMAQTNNLRLRQSMLLGSALEGGWTSPYPVGDHGTSFGPFQLHRGGALDSLGGTPEQANDPKWAVKAMMPRYAQAANQISEQQWRNNPEVAAEQTARIAEGPSQDYFASQGRRNVDLKWNNVQNVLHGKKSQPGMPTDANLTSAGDNFPSSPQGLASLLIGTLTGKLPGGGGGFTDFLERGALIVFGALLILVGILVLAAPGVQAVGEARTMGRRAGMLSSDSSRNFEARSAERQADQQRRTNIADRSMAIGERKVAVQETREQRLARS